MESPRDRYYQLVLEKIRADRYPSGELMDRLELALASRDEAEQYLDVLLDKIQDDRYPSKQMLDRVLTLATALDQARYPATAYSRHSSGTPLSGCRPRSANRRPEPTTRSLTVLEVRTSPGPASDITRAAMCTAMPPMSEALSSHSPVWRPARISRPAIRTDSAMSLAQRTPRAGPSNVARKPSPVCLTSRPPKRESWRRTSSSWRASRSRQRLSPSSAARSVEPTMSVNSTVDSTRSAGRGRRSPVRNSSISSTSACGSPSIGRWSEPSNSTRRAPRMCSAM